MASKKTAARARRRSGTNDLATSIRQLNAQREKIRTRVSAEREALRAKLTELDEAWAALGGAPLASAPRAPKRTPSRAAGAKTNTDMILAAIAALKSPTSSEIIAWMKERGRAIDERNFGSYLYKMKKAGSIRARGKKGAMKYSLPG